MKDNGSKFRAWHLVISVFLLVAASPSTALDLNEKGRLEPSKNIKIDSRTGFRKANLNWNIAAPDNQPNVLSELEYTDLEIFEASFNARAVVNKIYSRASISFGKILDGSATDSDYSEDNRTSLYSKSQSDINDEVHDLCIGLGYQMDLFSDKFKIAPLAGVSYHTQNIRQTNGLQTVSAGPGVPAQGQPLLGLNSSYETEWRSWFVGIDLDFEVVKNLFLSSSLEYHNATYEAAANWNLRDDFAHPVSFTHEALGEGAVVNISVNRVFAENWLIGFLFGWVVWSTAPGEDVLFWEVGATTASPLNTVNWDSQSLNISIGYNF
jgi:hypothetical protein